MRSGSFAGVATGKCKISCSRCLFLRRACNRSGFGTDVCGGAVTRFERAIKFASSDTNNDSYTIH